MRVSYIISIFLFCSVTFSCSKELTTTKRAVKYQQHLTLLSAELFSKFDQETFIVPRQFDSLQFSKTNRKLLLKKVKCPFVQIIYNDHKPRFLNTDSVVIFTRTGLPVIGYEYNIVIDMRKNLRDSILLDRNYIKYYKLNNGMYYIQDYMPGM